MKRKKTKGGLFRLARKLVFLLFIVVFVFVGFYFIFPDVSKLKTSNPDKTSFMKYREKQWKAEGKKIKIRKRWVSLKSISPYLVKAVMIAEDDKFWTHHGFDLDAIQKALEKNIEKGKIKFGGSTISQQLVKNLYLTPAKNPLRKLKEAIITWRVEQALKKRRILELYLNVAEWGEGIFGVEAASERYFGKSAKSLSAEESAKLAAILPNPIKYKVDGTTRYTERRAKIIYNIMVKRGIVIPAYEEVINPPQKEKSNDDTTDSTISDTGSQPSGVSQ